MAASVKFEDCEITKSTPKAAYVIIDGAGHWIPQSTIHDDSEIWKEGDKGDLVLHEWFAIKEGLV
jgi:hypothetical protein